MKQGDINPNSRAAANMGLAKWRVKCLNKPWCIYQTFVLRVQNDFDIEEEMDKKFKVFESIKRLKKRNEKHG